MVYRVETFTTVVTRVTRHSHALLILVGSLPQTERNFGRPVTSGSLRRRFGSDTVLSEAISQVLQISLLFYPPDYYRRCSRTPEYNDWDNEYPIIRVEKRRTYIVEVTVVKG